MLDIMDATKAVIKSASVMTTILRTMTVQKPKVDAMRNRVEARKKAMSDATQGMENILKGKDSKRIFGTSPNYKKHGIKIIIKNLLQNIITRPH